MAEKLSIQIALEGGAEIERQLADIGKAGQKAFADIAKSAEATGGFQNLKPEQVTASLEKMGIKGVDAINSIRAAVAQAARLEGLVQGIKTVEDAFASITRVALSLGRTLGPIGAAIGATFGIVANEVLKTVDAVNTLSAEAIKAGVSLEQFDRMKTGLQAAGVSAEGARAAIAGFSAELDKIKLDKLKEAIAELDKAAKVGFLSDIAKEALRQVQEAAQGVGAGADLARKALEKLKEAGFIDIKVPESAIENLRQIALEAEKIGGKAAAMQSVIDALQKIEDPAKRSALAMEFFKGKGIEAVQALNTGGVALDQFKQKQIEEIAVLEKQAVEAQKVSDEMTRLGTTWNALREASIPPGLVTGLQILRGALEFAGMAVERLKETMSLINPVIALLTGQFNPLIALLRQIGASDWFGSIISGAQEAWTAISIGAQQAVVAIGQFIEWVSSLARIAWDAISGPIVAAWNAITGAIQGAVNALLTYLGLQGQAGGPAAAEGGGGSGFAHGGMVRGRGSGTSDSNLAWVSRGEHIMPARAVRQPGVLAFLEALRRSGGNLSRVLNGMGRFALGGLVPSSGVAGIPARARGGMVGRPLTLVLDGQRFPNLSGPVEVVDGLERYATSKKATRIGRSPAWVR